MDNIYRILKCDVCGKEIRERHNNQKDTLYASDFEMNHYGVILTGGETKSMIMCIGCGDALLRGIQNATDAIQKAKEGHYADLYNG